MRKSKLLLNFKKESERNEEIIKNIIPAPTKNDLVKNQKIKNRRFILI